MDELQAADQFFKARLGSSSSLVAAVGGRIYAAEMVPQDSAVPYLRWQFQAGVDDRTIGGRRFMTRAIYAVLVVCRLTEGNPLRDGGAAADLADEVLDGAPLTVLPNGVSILGCRSLRPVRYVEPRMSPEYLHVGRTYDLYIDPP